MSRLLILAVALWVGHASSGAAAPGTDRIALVIGNANYEHTQVLTNPRRDAKAIAAALTRIGFDYVRLKTDLNYDQMRRTIRSFGKRARRADVALVFYAGHGLEMGGQNYLLPVDARLLADDDLEFEAVTLESVLRQVRSASKLRLVVLDACRTNPLASKMQLSSGATRSVSRGLSRIEPEGDVLVAYAAKHGTVAEDGRGLNSPYTTALLRHMETPGLEINFLFREVRDSVRKATSRRQDPFVYGSLGREALYLVPPSQQPKPKQTPATTAPQNRNLAAEAWREIKNSTVASDFETFISSFPNSFYAKLARARLQLLKRQTAIRQDAPVSNPQKSSGNEYLAWSNALAEGTAAAYRDYLRRFPRGAHAGDVRQRLSRLGGQGYRPTRVKPSRPAYRKRPNEYLSWSGAVAAGTANAYRDYLRSFPNGAHAADIRRRLRQLGSAGSSQNQGNEYLAWSDALSMGTAQAYRDFLRRYPRSKHAPDIRRRLGRNRHR